MKDAIRAKKDLLDLLDEPCSGSTVGGPLTKAFHWGRSKTISAALVVLRPA